jgi:pyruvate/2-oxoglutarate dehydrogenase complex dihydrolipoamide dehydrogenase (E3) component
MMKYDIIVIGGGSAGFSAAEVAANAGARVCLIEKGRLGGECPNWACVPTKALLRCAKLFYETKHHLKDFGIHASSVSYSFKEIMARKDAVVGTITGGGKKMGKIAKQLGIDVVKGSAKFVDGQTVQVAKKKYSAKKIIIATGTSPSFRLLMDLRRPAI